MPQAFDRQTTNHPTTMKPLYYFSRNYVEFGPFVAEEVLDFAKRGILLDSDYVRCLENHHWETVAEWVVHHGGAKAAKPAKTKTTAPRKKAAASTKSSKKAA
jgi:hypothetical protein